MLLNNIQEKSQSPIVNGKAIQKQCKKVQVGGGVGSNQPPTPTPNPCRVKALLLSIELQCFFPNKHADPFALFVFRPFFIQLLVCVQLCSRGNKLCPDFFINFVFHHKYDLLILSDRKQYYILFALPTCIKSHLYLSCKVFLGVMHLEMVNEAISIYTKQL